MHLLIRLSGDRNNTSRTSRNTSNRAPQIPIIIVTLPLGSHLFETACDEVGVFLRSNNCNTHVTLYTALYTSTAVSEDGVYLGGWGVGIGPETGVVVVSADAVTCATICDGEAGKESGEQDGDCWGDESHVNGFNGVLDGVLKIQYYYCCKL